LELEAELWHLAARFGGPAAEMPYAVRFRALEWCWPGKAYAGEAPAAVCIRCGKVWRPSRSIQSPPRCADCAKEPPWKRQGPAHALAPDVRGTWWLLCDREGCLRLFR